MQEDIKEILTSFLDQVESGSHVTSHYPTSYSDLTLDIGFGIGRSTNIPWVAFLGQGQTVRDGIFPVFYFFKKHHKIILAYGVSEEKRPTRSWFVPTNTKTVKQYFETLHITPQKYHYSYVYEVYSTLKDLDFDKMKIDLHRLIERYKKIMQSK